jgi:thioredoxin-dependent peroxiredoxin
VRLEIASSPLENMLAVGEVAPEFAALAGDGSQISLSAYRGRPLVLYFYPKANTTGCTIEARGFTEHYAEFQRAGVSVVGVSVDSVDAQKSFAERCSIPYPLVADHDRSIAKRYGVLGLLGIAKRVTFFLDAEGRVAEVVEGMLPGPHVRRALERIGVPSH